MEYTFNWQTGMLDPTQPPQLISTYFPGPGGPTASFPLSLNYLQQDPKNANAMTLTMCGLVGTLENHINILQKILCNYDTKKFTTDRFVCNGLDFKKQIIKYWNIINTMSKSSVIVFLCKQTRHGIGIVWIDQVQGYSRLDYSTYWWLNRVCQAVSPLFCIHSMYAVHV